MSESAPVTANLLTGFLGSGKTSLLRRLLRSPRLADTAVLINELGEVGLDHLLVEAVDEEVVLLKSGCVCCTIRGELKEALLGCGSAAAAVRSRPSRASSSRPRAWPIRRRSSPPSPPTRCCAGISASATSSPWSTR